MAQWRFRKHLPGEPVRNPIQGEFFATEAIANAAEALVREGTQNSLDADLPGHQPVQIRLYLSGQAGAIAADQLSEFTAGLEPHVAADRNGLRTPPSAGEPCAFLAFEDFGTTGLNGAPTDAYLDDDQKNGFFTFFRAEGLSQKDTNDRGRWGVGKTVFPRVSRAGVFFGLTVRSDDQRRLLMGRGTLKFHRTAAGDHFTSDGYYGDAQADVTLPIEDAASIARFAALFRLKRGAETGLSIVVPWCEPEIEFDDLRLAVIRGYFVPILRGQLTVDLETSDRSETLNAGTLAQIAATVDQSKSKDLIASVELAKWASEQTPSAFIETVPPPTTGAMKWSKELIPNDVTMRIRERLMAGEAVAVRVPIVVRAKNATPKASHFSVFLRRDELYDEGKPLFVREGLIISDIRPKGGITRKIRSLVVVDDGPLATLLGDSETPAHTQWQSGSNFKDKYYYGPSYIDFVTSSVSRLIRFSFEDDVDKNLLLAREFFSIPAHDMTRPEDVPTPKPGPKPPIPPGPGPPPRAQAIRIDLIAGGFGLRPGADAAITGRRFLVQVAYDVRRGSALKRYSDKDFRLFKQSVQLAEPPKGVEVLETDRNRMVIRITKPDFSLKVQGFDTARDLVVRVTEQKDAAET